jgi:hypothetical protein
VLVVVQMRRSSQGAVVRIRITNRLLCQLILYLGPGERDYRLPERRSVTSSHHSPSSRRSSRSADSTLTARHSFDDPRPLSRTFSPHIECTAHEHAATRRLETHRKRTKPRIAHDGLTEVLKKRRSRRVARSVAGLNTGLSAFRCLALLGARCCADGKV